MGTLVNSASGVQRELPSRCLVGRATHCLLNLRDRRVSGEHARIRWSGEFWMVRDLGSRNGTYVNGKKLPVGQDIRLELGSTVAFGEAEGFWTFRDASPPALTLERLDGARTLQGENQLLVYPSAEEPNVMIFQGTDGRWHCERDGEDLILDNGQQLNLDGVWWRVMLPTESSETWDVGEGQLHLSCLQMHFQVSLDEETVALTVNGGGRSIYFQPRAHHYTLLTLARLRQKDAEISELPAAEQGWVFVEALTRMLGMDQNALNVSIYRARRQLAKEGVLGAANIVERRVGTGQLRLGTSHCFFQQDETGPG